MLVSSLYRCQLLQTLFPGAGSTNIFLTHPCPLPPGFVVARWNSGRVDLWNVNEAHVVPSKGVAYWVSSSKAKGIKTNLGIERVLISFEVGHP